ncbi:MAG: tetratricopeptide repeat protein [Candidatus Omnitrophota bacterium]
MSFSLRSFRAGSCAICLFLLGAGGAFGAELPGDWDTDALGPEKKAVLEKARSYRDLKTYDFAKESYAQLVTDFPKNPDLLKEAGDVFADARDWDQAKRSFEKAVFLRPYAAALRLAWPRALERGGRRPEAIAALERLLAEDPGFNEARRDHALYLEWEKRWEEALPEVESLLKVDPADPGMLLRKGRLLNWSHRFEEAIPVYEEVLRREPKNWEAMKELAQLYSWTQQWEKSQAYYVKLYEQRPEDPEVLRELGYAYLYGGNYDAARELYGQLANFNPETARQLNARMNEIDLTAGPNLAYSFLYYTERDRSGTQRRQTETLYHAVEYAHPLTRSLKTLLRWGTRHDDTTKKTTASYGAGLQTRLHERLWHRVVLNWEPADHDLNPRWNLRNSLTWTPRDRWEATLQHQYFTFWDSNKAHSAGFEIARACFEKRDVRLTYRFTYDLTDDASPYFTTIKVREEESMDLVTQGLSAEKYWGLYAGFTATTGVNYQFTTLGRNTLGFYGYLGRRVFQRVDLMGGFSWSRDNHNIEAMAATGYANLYF